MINIIIRYSMNLCKKGAKKILDIGFAYEFKYEQIRCRSYSISLHFLQIFLVHVKKIRNRRFFGIE